jgi:hypothetical protein
MNTYLKKLDILSLPDDLNEFFKAQLDSLSDIEHVSYGGFSQNKNSLNYVDEGEHISRFGEPGIVSFLGIYDTPQRKKLWSFIDNQDPWFSECIKKIAYQFMGPGTHVPAHIDDIKIRIRKYSIIYLLDTGGDNVTTRWYKKKKEVEHLPEEENKCINYDNIECVYEHKLELHTWYIGNYSEIHSVENLVRMRTGIGILVNQEAKLPI